MNFDFFFIGSPHPSPKIHNSSLLSVTHTQKKEEEKTFRQQTEMIKSIFFYKVTEKRISI